MIKKAIFVLSALIAMAVNASAQQTGSWHYYPLYAGQPDKVEAADNGTVYYLSAGRLFTASTARKTATSSTIFAARCNHMNITPTPIISSSAVSRATSRSSIPTDTRRV